MQVAIIVIAYGLRFERQRALISVPVRMLECFAIGVCNELFFLFALIHASADSPGAMRGSRV
jgi:hypothetical protein